MAPELLDELEELLDDTVDLDATMLLGELDGLLVAVLLSPEPVAQDEWLPLVWGGEGLPFADEAQTRRLTELVLARKAQIAVELLTGDMAYQPVYEIDLDETPMWDVWMEGFARGVALRGPAWEILPEHEDEDLAAAAMGLLMLMAITQVPGMDGGEIEEQAPDLIPYLAETVYRRSKGLDRVVLAPGMAQSPAPLPFSPAPVKVGRNDPCPCGSGRKFKKCCAA